MRLSFLAPALLLAATLTAHADTFTTFTASGTFQTGSTLSGTLTLDETTGAFTASTLSVSSPDSLTFDYIQQQKTNFPVSGDNALFTGNVSVNNTTDLALLLGQASLIGYGGGEIGSLDDEAQGYASDIAYSPSDQDYLVSGTLTAPTVAATPEPSSLLLLATGTFGLATTLRRRLYK